VLEGKIKVCLSEVIKEIGLDERSEERLFFRSEHCVTVSVALFDTVTELIHGKQFFIFKGS